MEFWEQENSFSSHKATVLQRVGAAQDVCADTKACMRKTCRITRPDQFSLSLMMKCHRQAVSLPFLSHACPAHLPVFTLFQNQVQGAGSGVGRVVPWMSSQLPGLFPGTTGRPRGVCPSSSPSAPPQQRAYRRYLEVAALPSLFS